MDLTALVAEVVERMQTANPNREIHLAKSTLCRSPRTATTSSRC